MSQNNPEINHQSPRPNKKIRDSVFRTLFSDKENVLHMYRALHPEDTKATIEDIKVVTLENVLAINNINDLGFMVGNHLLILVEAQTRWSVNILVRSLLYLAESYKDYLSLTNQDYYSTKKVSIPTPELYVVYTGPERQLPEEISLQQEFFNNTKTSIEVNIKIIYNKDYRETDNIFLQYMEFISVYYRMLKSDNAPSRENISVYNKFVLQMIIRAVDYCIDNNILKNFLQEHKSEVIDNMSMLYDAEEIELMRERAHQAELDAARESVRVAEAELDAERSRANTAEARADAEKSRADAAEAQVLALKAQLEAMKRS